MFWTEPAPAFPRTSLFHSPRLLLLLHHHSLSIYWLALSSLCTDLISLVTKLPSTPLLDHTILSRCQGFCSPLWQRFLKELATLSVSLHRVQSGLYLHRPTELTIDVISDFNLPPILDPPSYWLPRGHHCSLGCSSLAPRKHPFLVSLQPHSPEPWVRSPALLNVQVRECLRAQSRSLLHGCSLPRPSHLVSWL